MQLQYQIGFDETISRWNITDMHREAFASPKRTFEAEVNLEESYIQVVYPVREEFLKEDRITDAPLYDGTYENLYFPFENNRIDLSTFIHTPHYISVNAKAGLNVSKAGKYPFEIYTCGGVKIWINGEVQELYAPYTRNIAGCKKVELELKAGFNEIKVYADELAERDVFFYFELRYKGDAPIEGVVEVEEDPERILNAEKFLKSCYFDRDVYKHGGVKLCYDNTLLDHDEEIHLVPAGGTSRTAANEHHLFTVRKSENCIFPDMFAEKDIYCAKMTVGMQVGRYFIPRGLFLVVSPEKEITLQPAATIAERKKQALQYIYNHANNLSPSLFACEVPLDALEIDHDWSPRAEKSFELVCRKIDNHEDCADFSFVPLTLLVTRYRDILPEDKFNRIKQIALNFRYWIDEPGDDVMWYFSENHAFLFHISQYLWGHIFENEIFTASGRTGREQYEIGKQRVLEWFEIFFKYQFAEWNSSCYIPIDLIGFFTLYINAPDAEIKEMAQKALDFTMKMLAYNTYEGVLHSSFGRIYEPTLKNRMLSETNFVTWINTGRGYPTGSGRAISLYAISDYEPHPYQEDCRPADGEGIGMEIDQGIIKVKIDTYRTRDYFTAATRRFKPFRHGHQQHIMNVAFGQGKQALFYVNHPGERMYSGENRPSYWAGNGTIPWVERYHNVTIMLFDTQEKELVHYIHAYAPTYEYDEYECRGNWFFAKAGDGYVAGWFSNGFELTAAGANTNKELTSQGLKHAVIVKCGSKDEFGSFAKFKDAMSRTPIDWNGERDIQFTDCQYGKVSIMNADSFTVNGTPVPYEDRHGYKICREQLKKVTE